MSTTTLDTYMDREGLKDADLAARIGRDRSMVSKLRRGRLSPTLEVAARIETETAGAVPIRSWLPSPPADGNGKSAEAA